MKVKLLLTACVMLAISAAAAASPKTDENAQACAKVADEISAEAQRLHDAISDSHPSGIAGICWRSVHAGFRSEAECVEKINKYKISLKKKGRVEPEKHLEQFESFALRLDQLETQLIANCSALDWLQVREVKNHD